MNNHSKIIHVSEAEMLSALESAALARSHAAASIFIPPTNSREYGCQAPGCVRPAYAKGLCNAHYIRLRKGLSMADPVRARKRGDACAECGEQTGAKGGWGLCQRHYKKTRYETLKDAAVAAFGSKCAHCSGSFHRAVFDFHHRGDKLGSPSEMFLNNSLSTLSRELAKCILLCANCHRLEHRDELRPGIREADWA
jgi:hypothetical protein